VCLVHALAHADHLVRQLGRVARALQDRGAQRLERRPHSRLAGFYVQGGAAMPANLVEIGFVTNPKEARRLREPKYRDEIGRAIFSGLADYKRAWDQRARVVTGPTR
jgi:N-acetylmuramoyl-L-alanine amidase